MSSPTKCAHPACECLVPPKGPYGQYCSESCKKAAAITELHCNCQHDACRVPERVMSLPHV
jgi:hypothetical protein